MEDHITRLLYQYHYQARSAELNAPEVHEHSVEALRQQWALTPEVLDLCKYVLENHHHLQSTVTVREIQDDVVARGAINARKTILTRTRTGHPTTVVYSEPSRIYDTGPNRVLAYVLAYADNLARRVARRVPTESSYATIAEETLSHLELVRRIELVSQTIQEAAGGRRPSQRELSQAVRSRNPIYHRAAEAYQYLIEIESGDGDSLRSLLNDTLVAPLETWRAFELATAASIAQALSTAKEQRVEVHPISSVSDGILSVGKYKIHWQSQTKYYTAPERDHWEQVVDDILEYYGTPFDGYRPDLVIEDTETRRIVSIIEVKYFSDPTRWKDALREATSQLVEYGRGYRGASEVKELLRHSALALWKTPSDHLPSAPAAEEFGIPYLFDFDDMLHSRLSELVATN